MESAKDTNKYKYKHFSVAASGVAVIHHVCNIFNTSTCYMGFGWFVTKYASWTLWKYIPSDAIFSKKFSVVSLVIACKLAMMITWLVDSLHGSLSTSLRNGDSIPRYFETTYKQNMCRSIPVYNKAAEASEKKVVMVRNSNIRMDVQKYNKTC